jgi:hypothetical protein
MDTQVATSDKLAPTCDFKPSQVRLDTFPFVGTFKKAECEVAAALLVRTCAARGDEWASQSPKAVGEVYKADVDAKAAPFIHWATNPFLQPDFHKLVELGFAEWAGDGNRAPIHFTAAGLERLRKFVVPATSEVSP